MTKQNFLANLVVNYSENINFYDREKGKRELDVYYYVGEGENRRAININFHENGEVFIGGQMDESIPKASGKTFFKQLLLLREQQEKENLLKRWVSMGVYGD